MQVTNNTNRKLGLPNGVAVGAGQSVDIDALDVKNPVIKAWIDSGAISTEQPKTAKRTTKTDKEG